MKSLGQLVRAPLSSNVPPETKVSGISTNAQTTKPGQIFFALRGAQHDGHAFIAEAQKQMPSAIVVEDTNAFEAVEKTVLVPSTRRALAFASSQWFGEPSKRLRLVGITGTNGKTTTTFLLKQVWDQLGKSSGLIGTIGNYLGSDFEPSQLTTPDAYSLQGFFSRMQNEGIQIGSMEVSSIALDQYRADGTSFEVAVFTNFTQDHLDYHQSFEKYFKAKQRLFTDFGVPNAVINGDDPYGNQLWQNFTGKKWRFGFSNACEFHVERFELTKEGTRALIKTPEGPLELKTPLIGRHNLYNCLAVIVTLHAMGENLEAVITALGHCAGAPGRLERAAPGVFVDYAHTDDALKNVLNTLRAILNKSGLNKSGRIITVFGCGGDRDKSKRSKMGNAASSLSEITIITSDNPRTENPQTILDDIETGIDTSKTEYHREVDRKKAIALALSFAKPSDIVLIAGKGHETYQIIGTHKLPLDDREVVRSLCAR